MKNTTKTTTSLLIATLLIGGLLLAPAPASAQDQAQLGIMKDFVAVMSSYLDVTEHWLELMDNEDSAIQLAVEGVKEVYKNSGAPEKAIPELEGLLESFGDRPVIRRVIRFQLRDLYAENGMPEKALEQLHAIIDEAR